jgi:hypothetical protein
MSSTFPAGTWFPANCGKQAAHRGFRRDVRRLHPILVPPFEVGNSAAVGPEIPPGFAGRLTR